MYNGIQFLYEMDATEPQSKFEMMLGSMLFTFENHLELYMPSVIM